MPRLQRQEFAFCPARFIRALQAERRLNEAFTLYSAVISYDISMQNSLKHFTIFTIAAGMVWGAAPMFEVASIKPAPPVNAMEVMHGNVLIGMKIDGTRVEIANLSLMDLIRMAYEVKPY